MPDPVSHDSTRNAGTQPERDVNGYYPASTHGGHLWKDNRGPESHCAREGCGLVYARWGGDRCWSAPDCTATMPGTEIRCSEEDGHDGDHTASVAWQ